MTFSKTAIQALAALTAAVFGSWLVIAAGCGGSCPEDTVLRGSKCVALSRVLGDAGIMSETSAQSLEPSAGDAATTVSIARSASGNGASAGKEAPPKVDARQNRATLPLRRAHPRWATRRFPRMPGKLPVLETQVPHPALGLLALCHRPWRPRPARESPRSRNAHRSLRTATARTTTATAKSTRRSRAIAKAT